MTDNNDNGNNGARDTNGNGENGNNPTNGAGNSPEETRNEQGANGNGSNSDEEVRDVGEEVGREPEEPAAEEEPTEEYGEPTEEAEAEEEYGEEVGFWNRGPKVGDTDISRRKALGAIGGTAVAAIAGTAGVYEAANGFLDGNGENAAPGEAGGPVDEYTWGSEPVLTDETGWCHLPAEEEGDKNYMVEIDANQVEDLIDDRQIKGSLADITPSSENAYAIDVDQTDGGDYVVQIVGTNGSADITREAAMELSNVDSQYVNEIFKQGECP